VVGRPFHIRFGGRTDFQYVGDTAEVFVRAATSNVRGAHVFNLHGETVHIDKVVTEIERAWPSARGTITCTAEPLAIPAEMDDSAIREALGPLPATALADGVGSTIARFAELRSEGRLDTSELDA
jgi:nucleoside-diphosphate-sugar epimerase